MDNVARFDSSPLSPTLPLSPIPHPPETPPRDTSWGAPAIRARFASFPMSLFPVRLSSVLGMPHDTRAVTSAPHVAATRVDRWTNIPFPVPSAAKTGEITLSQFALELFVICCWRRRQHAGLGQEIGSSREKRCEKVGGMIRFCCCCWHWPVWGLPCRMSRVGRLGWRFASRPAGGRSHFQTTLITLRSSHATKKRLFLARAISIAQVAFSQLPLLVCGACHNLGRTLG